MHYTRALAVNSMDEESLIGRGSCYTVTQQHDLAIADFTSLVRFPDQLRKVPLKHLYYVIAENYRRLQQWGEAIYWARKAHAADPGNERHQQLLKEISANLKKTSD
jgi:tetratricopeptide (TPR) repeat protein